MTPYLIAHRSVESKRPLLWVKKCLKTEDGVEQFAAGVACQLQARPTAARPSQHAVCHLDLWLRGSNRLHRAWDMKRWSRICSSMVFRTLVCSWDADGHCWGEVGFRKVDYYLRCSFAILFVFYVSCNYLTTIWLCPFVSQRNWWRVEELFIWACSTAAGNTWVGYSAPSSKIF